MDGSSVHGVLTKCRVRIFQSGVDVKLYVRRAGRPGDRGSIPGGGEIIFPLASVSRPVLGRTQPPVQWVLSLGLRRGRGVSRGWKRHKNSLRLNRNHLIENF
jgi:hypothetical protein